ncbi:hypothetical protein VOLCADRAFT_86283 [Volvox carteri f. nagariensis]|uniref:Phosphatidic acid phosphatase type 2/haloperoxidase domain-containing protein n=1 Tax=Volvox carteri f. nagariensis TaxID=3068 RepID=D8TID5_VOLCA|nr:uncharacterized protein VOLCADRAFT_86283 [Volvox carteri f. nagariensis]EFJ52873.1 hypothetical protein VOLCADRAFT_86283 [Volvox carteri f. nagariensis]|eukprot:XP_002945878.1 hypothetical protein VOLCADRAFT_86283 [Volvox carteri f. nagariensis]
MAFTDFSCVFYEKGDALGKVLAYAALLPYVLILHHASQFYGRRLVQEGVIVAGFVMNEGIARGLKHGLRHPRPADTCAKLDLCDSFGMPSSHTQCIAFAFMLHFLLCMRSVGGKSLGTRLIEACEVVGLAFACLLTASSRVYLGYHTTDQVVVGGLLGLVIGATCFAVLGWRGRQYGIVISRKKHDKAKQLWLRMDNASQLRADLEAVSKGDRHLQFKRSSSKSLLSVAAGGQGTPFAAPSGPSGATSATASAASSPPRRFLRSMTSAIHSSHSVSTVLPHGSVCFDRPPSASVNAAAAAAFPSRLPSRRASNASGGATDASGEEVRLTNSGGSKRYAGESPPSRRPSRPSRVSVFRDMPDYAAAISRQNQLEDTVAELEEQVRELAADNERRQESYMRREAALQEDVAKLEEQLRKARGEQPQNPTFGKAAANIRELHNQVVSQIEDLLTAQAASFRSEEHSTLRNFTARLDELEAAVVTERAKGAAREDIDTVEQVKKLRTQLEDTQQIAQILDKKHSVLAEENSRLRAQFKLQEADREYLIKQTVALKKENTALRNQLTALLEEMAVLNQEKEELMRAATAVGPDGGSTVGAGVLLTLGGGRPGSAVASTRPWSSRGGGGGGGGVSASAAAAAVTSAAAGPEGQVAVKIQRYEDVIENLKRLLEAERRRTKQARAAHTLELQQRTGLQAVLRQCVEDLRERRKLLAAAAGDGNLTPAERQDLISMLLGKEEILRAVFDRAFPGVTPHPPSDPYLDRMANWQEHRDAQVAANAKVIAAAKNAVLAPATAVKESTPGGMLLKEAANRPWVLNVDAMLSEFLGGPGGGGPGVAGAASLKSMGVASAASGVPGGGAGVVRIVRPTCSHGTVSEPVGSAAAASDDSRALLLRHILGGTPATRWRFRNAAASIVEACGWRNLRERRLISWASSERMVSELMLWVEGQLQGFPRPPSKT